MITKKIIITKEDISAITALVSSAETRCKARLYDLAQLPHDLRHAQSELDRLLLRKDQIGAEAVLMSDCGRMPNAYKGVAEVTAIRVRLVKPEKFEVLSVKRVPICSKDLELKLTDTQRTAAQIRVLDGIGRLVPQT